jgi:hypothetical protein
MCWENGEVSRTGKWVSDGGTADWRWTYTMLNLCIYTSASPDFSGRGQEMAFPMEGFITGPSIHSGGHQETSTH